MWCELELLDDLITEEGGGGRPAGVEELEGENFMGCDTVMETDLSRARQRWVVWSVGASQ